MRTRILLVVAVLVGACGSGGEVAQPSTSVDRPSGPIADLDPRSLYEDYASPDADRAVAAGPGVAAVASESSDQASSPVPPPAPSPVPRPPVPGVTDDNTFTDEGDNPWVATADDERSTFGLDVDTGSYTIARRFVEEGVLPEPSGIRIEEFVNALEPTDPAPTDAALALATEAGPNPVDPETLLARIGVRGREVAAADRPDANLVFVVDTSGSMDIRDRLGLVKASLAVLVQNLRPTDQVAIVTFESVAGVYLDPTPISDEAPIAQAIERLAPGGSTNLEGGLRTGYELANEMFADGEINRVILASDGVANVGETGPGSLVDLIRSDADKGIRLVTVGFGLGNYNDTLMERIADEGDGFYAYVDTFEEAERLFESEIVSTLLTIADDARIQVTFDPAAVVEYRLVGYENRDLDDDAFRDDDTETVTRGAGELGAGHAVVALYELRLVDGVDVGDELGSVALRWDDPESGESSELSAPIVAADAVSDHARLARSVAELAEVLSGQRDADLGALADRLDAEADRAGSAIGHDMGDLARGAAALARS